MNCNKKVLTYFYGDEDNKSSRTPIIKELREWAENYKEAKNNYENEFKPHRLISGAYKIGKNKTIERSLNKLNGKYLFINEETKIDKLDEFALQLKDHFFTRRKPSKVLRKAFEDEVRKFLEINDRKRFYDKLLAFLSLIQEIKKEDPQIRIIFVYESKSQLDTELFDALINSGVRFIFKIKVTPKELLDDESLTFGSLFSLAHHLKLKRLRVEESLKMIRGEHPDIKDDICGITVDILKKYFPQIDSSFEVLILDIVGCHPYLICELCSKIIDEINSFSNEEILEKKKFLSKLICNDSENYDTFFNIFFSKIKQYRNDLFVAYRNWILKNIKPQEEHLDLMNMFGMIFEKNENHHIPLLFKEYILKKSVKDFSINNTTPVKKILVLAANPKLTSLRRLDEEVREIKEGLWRSKYRDHFEIQSKEAVRLRDLRRALLDIEPHIVHFTGHGEKNGLLVENELGFAEFISAEALSGLFELFLNKVECVILNACYSVSHANAISKHIDYVIGMKEEISDKAAIEFAVGFYDALGAGRTLEDAFKFGRNAIQQKFPDQTKHLIPLLKKKNSGKKNRHIMMKPLKFLILLCLLFCLVGCSKKEKIVKDVGTFPWPPPKPSAFCKIPSEFLLKSDGETYLKDVLERLERTMDQAGYHERELCAVKHGFAIASRIEQFQKDGTPEIGNNRWEIEMKPLPPKTLITNFKAYLKAVFFTDVYNFRKIVFVVKRGELNERKNPITPGEAKKWFSSNVRSGRLKDILNIYYSTHYTCTALIYEFEKYKMNDEPIPVDVSNLTGKTHLEKSKLWAALENNL